HRCVLRYVHHRKRRDSSCCAVLQLIELKGLKRPLVKQKILGWTEDFLFKTSLFLPFDFF
ncbi:hypothetical protein, partial [Parasutterella excrementihominis]|uniref:hypothetical protein n=1 Tax=Parasutterella excrementihominis TaxID=487175 RepID=UPI003A8DC106